MAYQFNYELLLERMDDYRYSQSKLAKDMNLSRTSLNDKLKSRVPFTQKDIRTICSLLDIPSDEVGQYFFEESVRKTV